MFVQTMSTPFRIAFLGIDNPHGAGWRDLFKNFGDDLEITAILPGFGGATHSLEERLTHVPRFDSVEELIAGGEFDGAFIGLSNDEAPAAAEKLAGAGKHILLEKPVAGSAADAKPIIDAVAKSGVAFQTGYMWRYDELAERLRDMVEDNRFGKLVSVEINFVTSDVQRRNPSHYVFDREISTGGFFNWLACHYLDLLLYITGQKVVGVTSRVGVFGTTETEVEDGGIAILDLSGGGVASFVGGYWLPRWAGETRFSIRGSERWVHWDPSREGGALEIHGPKPQWNAMDEEFVLPVDETTGYGGKRGVDLVADWLAAARDGGRPCRNTPKSTVNTLALIDAIYEASETGRRVECDIGR